MNAVGTTYLYSSLKTTFLIGSPLLGALRRHCNHFLIVLSKSNRSLFAKSNHAPKGDSWWLWWSTNFGGERTQPCGDPAASMITYGHVCSATACQSINAVAALKPLCWCEVRCSKSQRVNQSRQPHETCERLKCHWLHVASSSAPPDPHVVQNNDWCSRHGHWFEGDWRALGGILWSSLQVDYKCQGQKHKKVCSTEWLPSRRDPFLKKKKHKSLFKKSENLVAFKNDQIGSSIKINHNLPQLQCSDVFHIYMLWIPSTGYYPMLWILKWNLILLDFCTLTCT